MPSMSLSFSCINASLWRALSILLENSLTRLSELLDLEKNPILFSQAWRSVSSCLILLTNFSLSWMILLSLSSLLSNVLILDLNRSIFFSNSSMSSWSKWSLISLRNSFWTVSFSLIGTNPISAQRVWKAFNASMSSSLLPVNLKLRTSSISSRFSSRFFSWSEETCLN